MADAFISYSRKDKGFVHRLDEALKSHKREAWVDWEGIRPTEEFMQAIFAAIESADTFIFVLTPDSVASPVCRGALGAVCWCVVDPPGSICSFQAATPAAHLTRPSGNACRRAADPGR